METIRYLAPQEKQGTRAMYEEIFPEDSVSFVDYYYEWKTKENKILAMVEDGVTQVMLHLNPYPVWIHGHCREVPYIVAVAGVCVFPKPGGDRAWGNPGSQQP